MQQNTHEFLSTFCAIGHDLCGEGGLPGCTHGNLDHHESLIRLTNCGRQNKATDGINIYNNYLVNNGEVVIPGLPQDTCQLPLSEAGRSSSEDIIS